MISTSFSLYIYNMYVYIYICSDQDVYSDYLQFSVNRIVFFLRFVNEQWLHGIFPNHHRFVKCDQPGVRLLATGRQPGTFSEKSHGKSYTQIFILKGKGT